MNYLMLSQKNKDTLKKIKNVKWLVPGWVFYEFYKSHKSRGHTKTKSAVHGAKAEVIRLAAFASIPLPGSYELTTTGLALLKKKIDAGASDELTLKVFKDFIPLSKIRSIKPKGIPHLKIFYKDRRIHFEVFYKK